MSGPTLLRGDARALPLADESVDLVVTSPPYFSLRDYGTDGQIGAEPTPAGFIAALIAATGEMRRVLKPSGSIFVNLGDSYARTGGGGAGSSDGHTGRNRGGRPATTCPRGIPEKSLMMLPERYRIACVDELGLIARAVIVWDKPNGLPESVTDRVRRSHEDWVHLTKSPRYFSAVDELRVPLAESTVRKFGTSTARRQPTGEHGRSAVEHTFGADASRGRLPCSVWSIPSQPLNVPAHVGANHYAAFPMEWPRRLITGWCPPGGVVLDPFGGTGTTALVAHMLGRRGISVDLSADYQRIADWRCSDPKERGRAAGLSPEQVAKIPAGRPDQDGLFGLPEVAS